MRHLFSIEGEQALESVMRQRPLLAFDFDGTLAPIVARPDQAHVPDAVAHGLAELSRALPVAVVTGRSVADVRARLGFQPRWVIGNHGAEDPDVGPPSAASQALEARFASKGMWENLMPVNHKARLWERYGEQHAEIMREVEDDFDSLFGGAFLEAYEAQLARLGRPPSA